MILKIQKKLLKSISVFVSLIFALLIFFSGISVVTEDVTGANITNATVIARVNISNVAPDIYDVVFVSPLDVDNNIDLQAGSNTTVVCNGSFQDANGFSDVANINATLFFDNGDYSSTSPDSNSTHYTNESCTVSECDEIPGSNSENASCTCNFVVQYYANYGNWRCNMTITDTGLLADSNQSDPVFFVETIGIELNNLSLDYGGLSVTQISAERPKNITNVGNVPINISLRSWGGTNESYGTNFTMLCDDGANITHDNQRFTLESGTAFADMDNVTNQTRFINELKIPKRGTDVGLGNSTNATFWRLQVPIGVSGSCNGTVLFGAVDGRVS